MLHRSNNIEITDYSKYEPRFNGTFSRDNLPKITRLSICHKSTTKFIIFSIHDVFCQYKWPANRSLFHLNTSSIYWRSCLLSSSVEYCCFIFILHVHQIIVWSLVLKCDKSPVDTGHVLLRYRITLTAQAWNTSTI